MPLVKIYAEPGVKIPKYETDYAAAMDICAKQAVEILAGYTTLVPTGLWLAIPVGYEIEVVPRSGMSLKTRFRIPNSPGTVDADYRGELCVIAENTGNVPISLKMGERIAQIKLKAVPTINWDIVDSKDMLGDTTRGTGGFGSTGQ